MFIDVDTLILSSLRSSEMFIPDGVQVPVAVAGYKHGTPDGVQVLVAVVGYKHGTP
jgi:hypothetical protein